MNTVSGPARVALILLSILCLPVQALCAGDAGSSCADHGVLKTGISQFYFESRMSYGFTSVGGEVVDPSCGFKGEYLNLRLDGQICDGLTYSYRQRLNKNTNATFFDSTDWLHLDWKVTPRLSLSAGKQVVAIGGYEYDRAPIDLYFCSEFWNNIPCYQMGVSATYNVTGHDQLLLQLCNSPMRSWSGNNKYALNLMWYGSHGWWETMWSANAIQWGNGNIYYLALGNRFNITDWLRWDVDLMDRYNPMGYIGEDYSVMTELSAAVGERMRIHSKFTYDYHHDSSRYHSDCDMIDFLVCSRTKLKSFSAGIEGYPLRGGSDFLKVFAVGGYRWGRNGDTIDVPVVVDDFQLQIGIKFRLDILRSAIR